jgi:hypothetical protein
MIVNQNHTGGALDDGGPEYFSGVNQGSVQDSPRYQNVPDHPMLRIQKQGMELLLPEIPKKRADPGKHVGRASDSFVPGGDVRSGTAPELQGGHDAGTRCRSDPRLVLESS